ncbi:MAG: MoaD/ThiS family protein [Bacteroidetes bacterium]|nr:MoaD/ThiS family protein [Bacteroidota bacterium]
MPTSFFKIRLFSVLKSKLKVASIELKTTEEITAGGLMDLACEQYPPMAPYRSIMRLAVNQKYVQDSNRLQDGDEIAIITPVSGG